MGRFPILAVSALLLICGLLSSCERNPSEVNAPSTRIIREETLVIGVLPEKNVFEQRRRYQPLTEYLSDVLHMNVRIKLLDSYGAIARELEEQVIDAAVLGSLNYVLMHERGYVLPVARLVDLTHGADYRSIVFTRHDTGITEDIRSWKDKDIALVHPATLAGALFPRWYLYQSEKIDMSWYFNTVRYMGSHDSVVLAVYNGHAHLGAAKDDVIRAMQSDWPELQEGLLILTISEPVPSNTLSLRSDLADTLLERLQETLVSMHTYQQGITALQQLEASSFVATRDEEFDSLRVMMYELGVDSSHFSFAD
ncbi:phosphonate ABC transporter, periplasmic phosphonate-binding protein [Desulfurispirillum indicum S5]|uniref:Phosphonate ABC transporter, periplasmic phosphonate-binding protein n=1 Tax=Desulfurispirillum indicum (strain ATCC BAA-1389 / DSM 22839 / S5) TaxID=653733 RepID=E6W4Q5_DESIS|nr:phosphate/phosphite/phosphonate ABC transporter substrate-binding protein [Desulfurispirillum indicum]ADU64783.1 phosphonate ABC transporter, periplasmic phosphonate-binding protein [Desulfurispirillum indicum S5]